MKINSNFESVKHLQYKFIEFCSGLHLKKNLVVKINLAIEEILVNIISYAYKGEEHLKIFVDFEYDGNQIKVVIKDMGHPFNINEQATVTSGFSPEDKIGGWGIHIVRSIMDGIEYTRTTKYNIVSLYKKINEL